MGGALVTQHVMSYCQRRARYYRVSRSFHSKSRLTSYTLLTRQNASVLKVGAVHVQVMEVLLAYSVTVGILTFYH